MDVANDRNVQNPCFFLPDGEMTLYFVCMVICVFGMVGNGIVLWFLGFQMKRNPFTVYILNLAVADCCVLIVYFLLIPGYINLTMICYGLDSFLPFFFKYVGAVPFMCQLFVLSSLGLLTAISTERSVSVIFPIWYRCHRPKHLSGIVSGVLWASVGSFMVSIYLCYVFRQGYGTVSAIVGILYSVILLRCVAVVLNVIFFFAFGMPFRIKAFHDLLYNGFLLVENVTLVLSLLNSSINPVIYFLVGSCRQRRFQGSIQAALRRVFEEKARSKEENPVPEGIPMESTAQGPAGQGRPELCSPLQ
uniref:Uncharacterized protein n=1 Tax=Melopsittacus undulatus TaxID=13146 RepID=A0A8V5G9M3_MELUD